MKVNVDLKWSISDVFFAHNDTVDDVKMKIWHVLGIQTGRQTLRVKGSSDELAGNCFIRTLGPVGTSDSKKENVDITLEIAKRATLMIDTKEAANAGRSAMLFANSDDTVNYLLGQFIGKDIQDYLMIHEGRPLKPSDSIHKCGLVSGSKVMVKKRINGTVNIAISSLGNLYEPFEDKTDANTLIGTWKDAYKNKTQIDVLSKNIILLYKGHVLDEKLPFSFYAGNGEMTIFSTIKESLF